MKNVMMEIPLEKMGATLFAKSKMGLDKMEQNQSHLNL